MKRKVDLQAGGSAHVCQHSHWEQWSEHHAIQVVMNRFSIVLCCVLMYQYIATYMYFCCDWLDAVVDLIATPQHSSILPVMYFRVEYVIEHILSVRQQPVATWDQHIVCVLLYRINTNIHNDDAKWSDLIGPLHSAVNNNMNVIALQSQTGVQQLGLLAPQSSEGLPVDKQNQVGQVATC